MRKQDGFIGVILAIIVALAVGGFVFYKHEQANKVAVVAPVVSTATSAQVNTNTSVTQSQIQQHLATAPGPITYTATKTSKSSTNDGGIQVNTSVTADGTFTESCGVKGCFDQKFAACQPATKVSDVEPIGSYKAEINGPAAGGCSVTTEYLKYALNPAWENKPMTCTYNNTVSFDDATSKVWSGIFDGTAKCSGPLYETIQADQAAQAQTTSQ